MYHITKAASRGEALQAMLETAAAVTQGETNVVANLANCAAVLAAYLDGINWAGFYVWNEIDGELVLGPFQGLPACIRIAPQRGVCGAAYTSGIVQNVADVHAFPGHIACDGATNSEIVLPLHKNGSVWGVLDIDSPELARFGQEEETALRAFAALVERFI